MSADLRERAVVDLRRAMRSFVTGVCVATTYLDGAQGRAHDAMTVNSLSSVSLDPPLISLCLKEGSRFLRDLLDSGVWGVSILPAGAEHHASAFARGREARHGLVDESLGRLGERTGVVLIAGSIALECRLVQQLAAGDHRLLIGAVVGTAAPESHQPLIFHAGGYHTLGRQPDGGAPAAAGQPGAAGSAQQAAQQAAQQGAR